MLFLPFLVLLSFFQANVVAPNKHTAAAERMSNGHLLESETYIGGKVEALEAGIFRSDLPCKFRCKPEAYQMLMDKLNKDLEYALRQDGKMAIEDCENYEEVRKTLWFVSTFGGFRSKVALPFYRLSVLIIKKPLSR